MADSIQKIKQLQKVRRAHRIRTKVRGTAVRPRLSVFRSHHHLFLQLIDDVAGKTLVSFHDRALNETAQTTDVGRQVALAKVAGQKLGELALAKGIKQAVFDKGAYKYHGRVQAVADGARAAGLEF